ncbi:MAG: hypothetical protein ACJARX_002285 [Psychroserpens sp.]|jgi:hypothetical protein|uniref:hypothetical protein n=1 Tax=Psychroserpens sp. TaxID=2020870 RepID=UPI0039E525D5
MNTQCDEDDQDNDFPCNQTVVVDTGFYESSQSDFFEFTSVQLNGNCLVLEFTASGCDGNSWSMVFVDSGGVAESFPEQRFLKFVLTNEEACLAVISQERSFDISPIEVEGRNEIILNIEDFSESLTYTY